MKFLVRLIKKYRIDAKNSFEAEQLARMKLLEDKTMHDAEILKVKE